MKRNITIEKVATSLRV